MITLLHLSKNQLSLNGETGNLDVIVSRLRWGKVDVRVREFDGYGSIPENVDAVFIGSGTLAGAVEALEALRPYRSEIQALADAKIPFLAIGLGWEILGESIELLDGQMIQGLGVFPSRSVRVEPRASRECFGFDEFGNLTTGYANHSSNIEIFGNSKPLIILESGFGNSSTKPANEVPEEGLVAENLMASRLNGPLLALNPHLADRFITMISRRSNFEYNAANQNSLKADSFAAAAREELKLRLTR